MSSPPGSITGAVGRRGKRKEGKRRRRNMRWWRSKEHRQRRSSQLSWKYTIGVRTSRAQQQQQQLKKNDYRLPSDYLEWTERLKGVNTQCEHPLITISETEDLFEGGNGNSQRLRSYILKKHNQCQRSVEVCVTPTHWSNRRIRGISGLFCFILFLKPLSCIIPYSVRSSSLFILLNSYLGTKSFSSRMPVPRVLIVRRWRRGEWMTAEKKAPRFEKTSASSLWSLIITAKPVS